MSSQPYQQVQSNVGFSEKIGAPWLAGGEPTKGRIARATLRIREDIAEVEKYRHEDVLPGRTILECIEAAAALDLQKPAMIWLRSTDIAEAPRVISYGELVSTIRQSANLFKQASGDSTPVVAVILPMVPESLIATWGAASAGICVPINPHLEEKSVVSILNAAKATVLVTTNNRHGSGVWDHLEDVAARVATLRRVLIVDSDSGDDDFAAAIAAHSGDSLSFDPASSPHAEAMYMPTGGTTAAPKLVRMTHWGQLTIAWNVGALMGSARDGVVGHGMPNFHCGGAIAIGLRTIIFGQTLVTMMTGGFRHREIIESFWRIARHYRITSVLATPTTAAAILAVPDADAQGHCIADFHCGGSTIPLELLRGFHDRFGVWLRENWGMTEVHGTVTGHPGTDRQPRVGSVGYRLPHCQVKAVHLDGSNTFVRECTPGERGTLLISVPSLMNGYLDASMDDQYFVKGMPGGGRWGNTGDLGVVDEDGYAWVFGRTKDLIVRGGHNIDPKPIEEMLCEHPAVQLAAAVGRPDPSKGELPIAYVQLREGERVSAQELIEFCKQRTHERAAVPVEIIVLESIPLTAVGKISKPALRLDAMSRTVRAIATKVWGGDSFDVSIDQSGMRPTAVLRIQVDAARAGEIEARLAKEFAGFEFATEIQIQVR
jgi:fatty-acyl-CoA synthase